MEETGNKIFKNFGGSTFFSVINQVIGVATSVKVTSYLGVEKYGLFSLLMVQVTLFSIIVNFGQRQVVIRYVARHLSSNSVKRIIGYSLRIKVFTFLISGLFFLIYQSWAKTYTDLSYIILAVLVLLFLQGLTSTLESVMFGLEKMWQSSALNTFTTLMWAVFLFTGPPSWYSLYIIVRTYVILQMMFLLLYTV